MMEYMTIENCPVTTTTSRVLYPYIDSEDNKWYSRYGGLHSGVDIECKSVHSVCQGVVILVGTDFDDGLQTVTVQYDAYQGFRYCHLASVRVKAGDIIQKSQWIADAKDFVHFEYIDVTEGNPLWLCRIGDMEYFKHNPEEFATGEKTVPSENLVATTVVEVDQTFPDIPLSNAEIEEFTNNRVDDEPSAIG